MSKIIKELGHIEQLRHIKEFRRIKDLYYVKEFQRIKDLYSIKEFRRIKALYRIKELRHIKELHHILKACVYSYNGIKAAFKSEVAFRQDLVVCFILLIVALALPVSLTQTLLMIMSLFIILIAELTNTAIETTVDRVSADIHPLSKKAKDIGSSIVFLSFVLMVVIYATIIISLIF